MSILRSAARKALTRVAAAAGYQLVPDTGSSLGDPSSAAALARHLQRIFADTGIDGVIDVGANEGQYYDFLRKHVGFSGPIVSLEPNPALVERLRARADDDSRWTVLGCAAGSADTTLPLKVMTGTGWSSLLDKAAVQATDRANTFDVERVVDVPVRRLDAALAEVRTFAAQRPYLKVDAQGFDLEVLKGAPETLAKAGAVQTELELIPVYDGAPHYTSVLGYLQERHYAITGVFPVWRDRTHRIGEMDTVLRNMRS